MEDNNTILQNIFNLFVSNDGLKPVLTKPFEINNKIYATDGHILIRIDKDKCDFFIEEPLHTPPNCESVIPTENFNLLVDVDKSYFEPYKLEDELVDVGEDIECDTCDGYGEVEWEFQHYTNNFDCPVCNGSGYAAESQSVKTGNKTFGKFDLVKIKNAYLNVNNFYKLLDVKEKLNEPIYLIHQSSPNKAVLFRVGICEILIMPMIYNGYDDNVLVDLKL